MAIPRLVPCILVLASVAFEKATFNQYEYAAALHSEIRQKWGVESIIRDLEHLQEDMSQIIELQEIGLIGPHEALFYFFRMHDFDDNEKLDGREFWIAVEHHLKDKLGDTTSSDDIIGIVDEFLSFDDGNDGFVSYSEFRKYSQK